MPATTTSLLTPKPNCAHTFFSQPPNFFSPPPSSFFPFLLVSPREVPSLCVKLFKMQPGANKQTSTWLALLIASRLFDFQLQANPAEEKMGNKYLMSKKVPLERVLVPISSSPPSLSALKHHHYMSFSAQLPLNTKRGIVQRNPVVNTKWQHFIPTALHCNCTDIACTVMLSKPVVDAKCE